MAICLMVLDDVNLVSLHERQRIVFVNDVVVFFVYCHGHEVIVLVTRQDNTNMVIIVGIIRFVGRNYSSKVLIV